MPDTPRKISELTAATAIDPANDLLTMVDVSESSLASKNKRLTIAQLLGNLPLGTASAPGVAFAGNPGTGLFSPGANELAISTNGIECARYTSDGYLRLASKGIQFNGDTADSNSLDDYEEGTWTPAISNTGYSYTYGQQVGRYTKVGRLVTLSWRILVTARSGSPSSGNIIIVVPFTTNSPLKDSSLMCPQPAQLVVHKAGTSTTIGARTFLYAGLANGGNTYFWVNSTDAAGNSFDTGADFVMGGSFTYEV